MVRALPRLGGGVDEHGGRSGCRALAVNLFGDPLLERALHLLLDVQEADAGQIVAAQPADFGFGFHQSAGDGQLEAQLNGRIQGHRPVELERPYFYCRACRGGVYPLDEALDLVAGRRLLADADRHKAYSLASAYR